MQWKIYLNFNSNFKPNQQLTNQIPNPQTSGAMSQHSQFGHHHHHPHSHPAVLHNASLAEIASQPASSHHYSSNLGSAVATSMHLTNSTSETDAGNSTYKMEHDLMYYSVGVLEFFFHFAVASLSIFFLLFSSSQAATKSKWIKPYKRWLLEFHPQRWGFAVDGHGGERRWVRFLVAVIFVRILSSSDKIYGVRLRQLSEWKKNGEKLREREEVDIVIKRKATKFIELLFILSTEITCYQELWSANEPRVILKIFNDL